MQDPYTHTETENLTSHVKRTLDKTRHSRLAFRHQIEVPVKGKANDPLAAGGASVTHARRAGRDPHTITTEKRLIADAFQGPLRVVLIDTDPADQRDLQNAFRRRARHWQLRCFCELKDALERVPRLHADVLLISTELTGLTALDVARMLRAVLPHLAVLLLARRANLETVLWYHQLPAEGYLVRPLAVDAFIEAIARAARGLHTLSDEAYLYEQEIRTRAAEAADTALTQRECQVMDHIADGLQNKEIAAVLGITADTVHGYRTHIYRKLHAKGKREAVRKYLIRERYSPSP